ncbi:MAG: NUDIX domain-containing protein [Helicobacter sp.]|nr:NUDIX domain-containing protein [Helicobacteraceae bacterium]MDY3113970.1 NUDIX domain-containing protein [Helicobacter sp.]
MQNITNIRFSDCVDSKYIKPKRVLFCENGVEKSWDIIEAHNSVAALLYHTQKDSFIFVKQFRPAVYLKESKKDKNANGYTYELCAGIMDKNKSEIETMQEEILEECGFKIPLTQLTKITEFYSSVGFAGSKQTLYFAKVDDSFKINCGGGIEDENIEVVYIKKQEALEFMFNESYHKTSGLMFSLLWYFRNF